LSNDHYLVVSYFIMFGVCLGIAALTHRLFREPFGRIADAALKDSKSAFLKRALPVVLAVGATFAFLGVSYTYNSCRMYTYAEAVKERSYLQERNRAQLGETSIAMARIVVMFSVAALVCIIVIKRNKDEH
jgi:hypothetical protein